MASRFRADQIRPPSVAGTFYQEDPARLATEIDGWLSAARPLSGAVPKALIVPHAGHVYSGPIAASAYALLTPVAETVRRVVLLGPAHRAMFQGIALPEARAFATPLGLIPVDADACATLSRLPGIFASDEAHAGEHSLEVQLPFLQRVLREFALVPMAVGDAEPQLVARAIDAVWGGPETLVLVSSDLSHYLPYDFARSADSRTAARIVSAGRERLAHENACGATPINGLLLETRKRELHGHLLDLRNSGDTAGRRDRVVGYGAFAFVEASHA